MAGASIDTLYTAVSIQIPESAEAGDELRFVVEGKEFTIPVPPSSHPGDVLQIKVGGTTASTTKSYVGIDERTSNAIQLVTGSTIFLPPTLEPFDSTTQTDSFGSTGSSDGTYLCLWPASRFAIDFLNSKDFERMIQHDAPNVRSVLELGCGSGVFGMSFADIIANSSSSQKIIQLVLTDMQDAMDQLRRNVGRNRDSFKGRVQVATIPLAWHSLPLATTSFLSIDYILGSDLLYNCSKISDLVATMKRLLSRSTKILLSVRWRKPIEERAFFVALSDAVEWEMVCGRCPLGFRDYGNPVCEESNKWFTQTMVGCGGQPIPLSLVDEGSQSRMTDTEFDEYERLQTQIYLGTAVASRQEYNGPDSKRHKV